MKNFFTVLRHFLKIHFDLNFQQPELRPLPAFWQMIPVNNFEKNDQQ
jgi:hypothetical protein